jgi:hypothetical protein
MTAIQTTAPTPTTQYPGPWSPSCAAESYPALATQSTLDEQEESLATLIPQPSLVETHGTQGELMTQLEEPTYM